jgi:uncharacterized protein (TIGR04255 family)
MADPLPEFEQPPVSEVAISVDFAPLDGWLPAHAGLYWALIQKQYPKSETHHEASSVIEQFGDNFFQPQMPRVELVGSDELRNIRHWFLNETKTELIQVQRDRFIINWRKLADGGPYPRYEQHMRPRWIKEWSAFKGFIAQHGLGEFNVRQCEITYVNDIPQGQGWEEFADALRLFSWDGLTRRGFLPPPQTLQTTASYEMPQRCGRLHIAVRHVLRNVDLKQVVQLRLVARGKPESQADDDVLAWFDRGREWIVRGFTDVTSEHAHKLWKRVR